MGGILRGGRGLGRETGLRGKAGRGEAGLFGGWLMEAGDSGPFMGLLLSVGLPLLGLEGSSRPGAFEPLTLGDPADLPESAGEADLPTSEGRGEAATEVGGEWAASAAGGVVIGVKGGSAPKGEGIPLGGVRPRDPSAVDCSRLFLHWDMMSS